MVLFVLSLDQIHFHPSIQAMMAVLASRLHFPALKKYFGPVVKRVDSVEERSLSARENDWGKSRVGNLLHCILFLLVFGHYRIIFTDLIARGSGQHLLSPFPLYTITHLFLSLSLEQHFWRA